MLHNKNVHRWPLLDNLQRNTETLAGWYAHEYGKRLVGNPPTPAASRGSASEEALLVTRGEKRKFAGAVLRPCCLAVAETPF